ncbi:diguanylate cyclase [Jiella sp. M17.18]|uniref:diguanylate cyclase domain-containing protein n=1 Tax=Jiella sp. M17.18 TaxID=3234247 RepID=UPI0034DF4BC4
MAEGETRAGQPTPRRGLVRLLARNLLCCLSYFLAFRAAFGFTLLMPPDAQWAWWVPIWFPAGIALGLSLRYGAAILPGAWIGSVAADLSMGLFGPSSFLVATVHAGEPLLILWLLKRGGLKPADLFVKPADAFRFVTASLAVICLFSAPIGGMVLAFAGNAVTLAGWAEDACRWGLADLAAVLVVTPPLHLALQGRSAPPGEAGVSPFLVLSLGFLLPAVVFSDVASHTGFSILPVGFVLFPLVVWSGLRQRPLETACLVAAIVVTVCAATAAGHGPFATAAAPPQSLFLVEGFIIAISLTGLLLAAANAERLALQGKLRALVDGLDTLIEERTAELHKTNRRLQAEITAGRRTAAIIRGHSVIMEMLATGRDLGDIAESMVEELHRSQPSWDAAILVATAEGGWCILGGNREDAAFARLPEQLRNGAVSAPSRSPVAALQRRAAHAFRIRGEETVVPAGQMHFEPIPLGRESGEALLAIRAVAGPSAQPFDIELARDAARLAGIVIENCRTQERLRHAATHDTLTGALNRHGFFDAVSTKIRMAATSPGRLAIFYVDLDGFKSVNDRCGHEVGDRLLVEIARRIGALLKPDDLLCRLGGDEFVMALGDLADREAATLLAVRLVAACRALESLAGTGLTVTPSIGIAFLDNTVTPIGVLLDRADAAMYAAKRDGGGRAAFHDEIETATRRSASA